MGTQNSSGFTIIETMLFLAVTGLLILGVLIGTGTALNNQRYKDAVESFKVLLQKQYSDLTSVRNDRSNTWRCDTGATATPDGTEIRGQSNCVIVGKYMRIDRGEVTVYTVLARQKSTTERANDIETLKLNYSYNIASEQIEPGALEWGTQIAWPKSGTGAKSPQTPRTIGILFVRSPDSGSIYTFSTDAIPAKTAIANATFTSMMVAGNAIPGQGSRTLCVLSDGMFPSGDMALYINSFAAGPSAIETRSNDIMVSLGVSSKC